MSFLGLEGKTLAVFGVANKKSVGFAVGRTLEAAGAAVVYVAHTEARRERLVKILPERPILVCDVEDPAQIEAVAARLGAEHGPLAGFVHSIAFADYSEGFRPFHETPRQAFLQAMQVSCHSFVELAGALKPHLEPDAGVVTISISSTTMAAENYGFMAPVKAALDSAVVFLAKSFAADTRVRFNAVAAGLLKTASSAGIPGYVDSYMFAEKATLRKKGVATREVADVAAFLVSPRAAGVNAQRVVVDAGMGSNYFDRDIVKAAVRD